MHFDFTLASYLQELPEHIWGGWTIIAGVGGSLLVAAITTFSQKKTASFYYGKLTEKVDGLSEDVKELRNSKNNHETRISHLEGAKHSKAWGAGASQ